MLSVSTAIARIFTVLNNLFFFNKFCIDKNLLKCYFFLNINKNRR